MSFADALAGVLRQEGGYVNDPRDPGGETKFGISKRAFPNLDIANLTVDQASDIYRRDYWDVVKGDQLPSALAACVFSCAVNMGNDKAVRLLQRACGVQVDGILGQNTLRAASRLEGAVARFCAEWALAYTGTRNFDLYGRGWLRRVMETALEAK